MQMWPLKEKKKPRKMSCCRASLTRASPPAGNHQGASKRGSSAATSDITSTHFSQNLRNETGWRGTPVDASNYKVEEYVCDVRACVPACMCVCVCIHSCAKTEDWNVDKKAAAGVTRAREEHTVSIFYSGASLFCHRRREHSGRVAVGSMEGGARLAARFTLLTTPPDEHISRAPACFHRCFARGAALWSCIVFVLDLFRNSAGSQAQPDESPQEKLLGAGNSGGEGKRL